MPIDIQFNEHLPGMRTWQTMNQEELLQYLENQKQAKKAEVEAVDAATERK